MKNILIIALSIIIMSLVGTDAFSQRGRGMRPMQCPQFAPYRGVQPGQPGSMRPMRQAGPARQMGQAMNCMNIEGLTDEQREQLGQLQTARMEKSLQHRTQMDELRAKKRSAMIKKESNLEEVNNIIDEMESVRTAWMKENIAHMAEVRSILTEEQRVIFDSRRMNRPMMRGRR